MDLHSAAEGPLLLPALVVTEVGCLLADRVGPVPSLRSGSRSQAGSPRVEPVLDSDWIGTAELREQPLDLPLGIGDACVIVLVERRGADRDHRPPSLGGETAARGRLQATALSRARASGIPDPKAS